MVQPWREMFSFIRNYESEVMLPRTAMSFILPPLPSYMIGKAGWNISLTFSMTLDLHLFM